MLGSSHQQGQTRSGKGLAACVSAEPSQTSSDIRSDLPSTESESAFPGIRFHDVDQEIKLTARTSRRGGKDHKKEQSRWEQTRSLLEKLLLNRISYEKLVTKGIIVPREPPIAFASSMETKLHERLPFTKVVPISSEVAYSLEGPDLMAGDGEVLSYEDIACAWSISTYPHIPDRPDREGDPICDRFSLYGYANRTVVVLTDGCNWGLKSKNASLKANTIFGRLLKQSLDEITDLRKAGFCLLRALDEAHYGVIQTGTELQEAGSTTILAGLLMQLDGPEKKKAGQGGKPKWVYICLNVGDCKTFHYSRRTGKFTDVTKGNRRAVNDPCDPGGRIGLYVENERPDLRNIGFYVAECEEDDLLFVVSDGVHDNFDAQHMGLKPKDINLPLEAWEENVKNVEEVTEKKHKWVVDLLERMFKDEVSPQLITRRVIEHARALTRRGREFMEQNPNSRVPRNEVLYTGKMDHTTCCCFRVTSIKGAPERKARPPVPSRRPQPPAPPPFNPKQSQRSVSSPDLLHAIRSFASSSRLSPHAVSTTSASSLTAYSYSTSALSTSSLPNASAIGQSSTSSSSPSASPVKFSIT